MTNGHILTRDDAWTGGHYELLFDVGEGKPAPDQVILYLPLGSLVHAWPQIGGFPFQQGQDTRIWQEPLDNWLAGIAADTYARARFSRAVIDFELDADYDLWRSWTRGTVPVERRVGLLLTAGDGLDYLARTVWE